MTHPTEDVQVRADAIRPGMEVRLVRPRGDSPLDNWTQIGDSRPESDGASVGLFAPTGEAIHECGYLRNDDGSTTTLPYPWPKDAKFFVRKGGQ